MTLQKFKRALQRFSAVRRLRDWRRARRFRDDPGLLVYVHIGKCGGASLWKAVCQSSRLRRTFRRIEKVHIEKPPLLTQASYIIVVRNPIKRALSAFNWRYKIVVTEGQQADRFPGEAEILKAYGSLNALAERLYGGDGLDPEVARDFRRIHHLREDIAFYLSELVETVRSEQIFGVLATETLDADIAAQLEITNTPRVHDNSSGIPDGQKYLSNLGQQNLAQFLSADYDALAQILDLNSSTHGARAALMSPLDGAASGND